MLNFFSSVLCSFIGALILRWLILGGLLCLLSTLCRAISCLILLVHQIISVDDKEIVPQEHSVKDTCSEEIARLEVSLSVPLFHELS